MEKQNRAQRRKSKFGGGRSSEQGGWPTSRPNPAFGADAPADAKDETAADQPSPAPDGAKAPKG